MLGSALHALPLVGQRQYVDAVLRTDLSAFVEKAFSTVTPGEEFCRNWHVRCHLLGVNKSSAGRYVSPPHHHPAAVSQVDLCVGLFSGVAAWTAPRPEDCVHQLFAGACQQAHQ